MLERVLIAGSGGQGVLLIGKLLATVAMENVPFVTYYPSYGAEVRGGVSKCEVILSSREIASPVADRFEALLIMNQASLDRFWTHAAKEALALVNTTLCQAPNGGNPVAVDATQTAFLLGDVRVANFIMLGAYLAARPIVKPSDLEAAIRTLLEGKPHALVDLNIKAFRLGLHTPWPGMDAHESSPDRQP